VEEAASSTTGLGNAGSMAQVASAGFWTTTITLVNTGAAAAQVRLNFFGKDGTPLELPLTFPQLPVAAGPLVASTLDRTLNPGTQVVVQTTGPASQPVATEMVVREAMRLYPPAPGFAREPIEDVTIGKYRVPGRECNLVP
jgi:hypothetical protein